MNLRTRFFLVLFGLGLIILGVFASSLYVVGRTQIVRAQNETQAETLGKVASICREAAIESNYITAINFFKLLRKEPGIVYAGCLDATGCIRAHTNPSSIGNTFPAGGSRRSGISAQAYHALYENWLEMELPIEVRGSAAGTAVLAYDKGRLGAEVRRRVLELIRGIALVTVVVLLTVVLGGATMLARSLAAPISALEVAAAEFGKGHFDYDPPSGKRMDEVGSLARSLAAMARRLGELDRLKESFLQHITHDLRSPLTAIHGYAEMISEGMSGPVTPKQVAQLKVVQENSLKLGEYIDDILDLAKMEAGGLSADKKRVDLGAVLQAVTDLLGATAAEYRIALSISREPDLPSVLADADLIRRAVTNLVGNALKFTPKDGKIVVAARRDGPGAVRVSVSDTGPGIPKEKLEKVFDKFFQVTETKGVARKVGTGLGLTITREIVQAHGGNIWAESEPGHGTTFSFTLPIG